MSASHATAACYSGHPDIRSERRDSEFVILGNVTSSKDVMSKDEPEFVDQTVYTVAVLHSFKGKPARNIKIKSVNTSTRFPMDIGQTYLLFVMSDTDGGYFVDSCGNSGATAKKSDAEKELESGQ
ncbi:hypothetical protein KPL74_20700 [Bacillus sp. NP157]|nr:hypothetical protein KPL74_20700 [Bacillus sp. NP157]